MSASSVPINPTAFAEALTSLPLGSLYAKGAEIQNSIAHLQRSNEELQQFIQETEGGDKDCEDAVKENEVVIGRMEERIELLKTEIEGRGQTWTVGGVLGEDVEGLEGGGEVAADQGNTEAATSGVNGSRETGNERSGGNTEPEESRSETRGDESAESQSHGVYL
ncbi:hypothetical protein FQN54_002154 [Arachnomyces sp. PD_36]|nr:hypothetical protein FQN54_002154 [Arachnomyces sp. PD_36]